jgi:two-component system cell cycle sensor histidine kinase/response regulator CckA
VTSPSTLRERLREWPTLTGTSAYALAVASEAIAVILTRLTWSVMFRVPFALLFLAVYLTTRWGTRSAGVLATMLATVGATVAIPTFGSPPFGYGALAVFTVVSLVGSHVVSERNAAIAALRTSEAQFRATWEHAALGAAVLDRQGRVERINPALERFLGYPASTWLGRALNRFGPDDDAATEAHRFADLMAGSESPFQIERRYWHQDGTIRWGRLTFSAVRSRSGSPTGALVALEDITAKRQAEADLQASEEKLRRAQKMEAVGQLVAGVAHNFNNLLLITGGYADLLIDQPGRDEHDRQALDEIRRAAERGAALTRQMLAFSRKRETKPVPVDLNRLVAGMRALLARAIREDTELSIEPAPAHATVHIDHDDLEQVILNLVINARDALPNGGHIGIDLGRQRLDADDLHDATLTPGEYVRLRIRDDGIGMSPEVQAHLFEPFFTTKEVGQGTGLGLAFVYGTVRQHQGLIAVDSTPDVGTTFSLYFPLQPEAVDDADLLAPSVPLGERGRAASILLVEDEAAVRAVTARTLRRGGHRVFEAGTPTAACALFDRHADEIDLLLTDVVMPEMHGPALAERLVRLRPTLRVLFVSGHSDVRPATVPGEPGPVVLSKPFAPAQLIGAVADVLGLAEWGNE